jgi:hypothetical protein
VPTLRIVSLGSVQLLGGELAQCFQHETDLAIWSVVHSQQTLVRSEPIVSSVFGPSVGWRLFLLPGRVLRGENREMPKQGLLGGVSKS